MSTLVSSTFDGLASVDRYGNLAPIVVDRLDERYAGGEATSARIDTVEDAVATKEPSATAMRLGDRDVDAVRQYGAPTDGTTTALTALNNAAAAAAGRRLVLRQGTYLVASSRVTQIKAGTVVQGEGPGATVLAGNALVEAVESDVLFKDLTIRGTLTSGESTFLAEVTTARLLKNWRFENVRFENVGVRVGHVGAKDNTGATVTAGSGLHDHIEFEGCEWAGFKGDGALFVKGATDVTVDRCRFHDIGTSTGKGDMLKMSYGGGGRITHCDFWNGQRDAVDVYDGTGVLVEGCTMTDIGVHAVESKFTLASTHSSRHKIINNTAIRCQTTGSSATPVFQLATDYVLAMGNRAEGGPGSGFRCGTATDDTTRRAVGGSWIGNYAIGLGGHGFTAGADRHSIFGNTATGNTLRGFYIPSATASNIAGKGTNNSWGNGYADEWTATAPA